jgi:hypothetical protein
MSTPCTARITLRSVYGKTLAYPANELADMLADVAGIKTFTRAKLNTILVQFSVEIVDQFGSVGKRLNAGECHDLSFMGL